MGLLTTWQRYLAAGLCVLILLVLLYFVVLNNGKASATVEYQTQQVEVLKNEIKKNGTAQALADDVERDSDGAVVDWLQSNGFYRGN